MDFPFPMFLTAWHMFFATVITQIMSRTTNMLPGVKEVTIFFITLDVYWFLAQGKVDSTVIKKQILPVALLFALSLVLSNKAYIYLSVSYIQATNMEIDF